MAKKAAAKKEEPAAKKVVAIRATRKPAIAKGPEEEPEPKNAISNTLSQRQLDVLIRGYGDGSQMETALVKALPEYHLRTRSWARTIFDLFHDASETPPPEGKVTINAQDRERCLIVLLASRGEQRNLALHIYVALMLLVPPEEIGDLIFLAAVYTGVPTMADGFKTALATMAALSKVATTRGGDVGPEGVMRVLMEFPL